MQPRKTELYDHLFDREYKRIERGLIDLIKAESGILFNEALRRLLRRKLFFRIRELNIDSPAEYFDSLIKKDPAEWKRLVSFVTIGHTGFFRHSNQFDFLKERVLPDIIQRNRRLRKLRIWSAGCATGEEAYSIAMLVCEELPDIAEWDVKILASDIDYESLKIAYRALYSPGTVSNLPEELRRKYMKKDSRTDFYAVSGRLRDIMMFRRINLASFDFNFSSLINIIFCRNVMIYFDSRIKKRIVRGFHKALSPGGFLFVSPAEPISWLCEDFVQVAHSICRKRG